MYALYCHSHVLPCVDGFLVFSDLCVPAEADQFMKQHAEVHLCIHMYTHNIALLISSPVFMYRNNTALLVSSPACVCLRVYIYNIALVISAHVCMYTHNTALLVSSPVCIIYIYNTVLLVSSPVCMYTYNTALLVSSPGCICIYIYNTALLMLSPALMAFWSSTCSCSIFSALAMRSCTCVLADCALRVNSLRIAATSPVVMLIAKYLHKYCIF